jgi:hypothetical protein
VVSAVVAQSSTFWPDILSTRDYCIFGGVYHPVRVMSLFEVPPGRYGGIGGIDEGIGPGTSFFLSRVHSMRLIRIGQIVRSSS